MRTGKPGKRRRAEEQADMSLFGQECNDKRGERSVLDEGGDICLHFPEPFLPPPSLSPLMAGSSQRFFWEGNKDQEGMGDSDLIRCRTSPLH